jgi:hypothetical protein
MQQCPNFFELTQNFEKQIGSTGSFIWASYSGLWKIYTEVNKINNKMTISNWREVEDYLLDDVPTAWGIDLKELAINTHWDDHRKSFEQLVLSQAFVLYEEWAILFSALIAPSLGKISEVLQFPSTAPRNKLPSSHPKTWMALKSSFDSNPSTLIQGDYQPALVNQYAKTLNQLDTLLYWYRFFKECRNAYTHAGGLHSSASVQAYTLAAPVSLSSIGMGRDVLLTAPPVVGDPINLGLENSVLSLGVIGRLANAFDAVLCHSKDAELYMTVRLKQAVKANLSNRMPGGSWNARVRYLRSALRYASLPFPKNFANTEVHFKANKLIAF